MNIYVGNLSPEVTEEELRKEFTAFGRVTSVRIIKDRDSRRPRGFGFVDMPSKSEGQAAISGLNSKELRGRPIIVNEARPPFEGRRGGGRPGGGYQGGGQRSTMYEGPRWTGGRK